MFKLQDGEMATGHNGDYEVVGDPKGCDGLWALDPISRICNALIMAEPE